jgi:hypothetical protein
MRTIFRVLGESILPLSVSRAIVQMRAPCYCNYFFYSWCQEIVTATPC